MIIPSLLQQQIVTSLDDDEPPSGGEEQLDHDGLSHAERANIKRALEALASHDGSGKIELLEETKRRATEAALKREEDRNRAPEVVAAREGMERRPPTVKAAAATPIAVPRNAVEPAKEEPAVVQEEEPVAVAAPPAAPSKKMSRFKARQLGLEQ